MSPQRDTELFDAIQKTAVEWPSYGRLRTTEELRRSGWVVELKRIRRLMREDNLLRVRKRTFVVTTDSNHTRQVYSNLAWSIQPKLLPREGEGHLSPLYRSAPV